MTNTVLKIKKVIAFFLITAILIQINGSNVFAQSPV